MNSIWFTQNHVASPSICCDGMVDPNFQSVLIIQDYKNIICQADVYSQPPMLLL